MIKIKQYRPIGDKEIITLEDIRVLSYKQLSRLVAVGYVRIEDRRVHLMTGGHILEAEFIEDSNSSKMPPINVHFIDKCVKDINLIDFYPNGKVLDIDISIEE